MGTPVYDKEAVLAQVLPRLADGDPLAVICRDYGMPEVTAIYRWRDADPALAQRIADARMAGADKLAHDCLELAKLPATTMVEVMQRRLQIETILKLLAKWFPKTYGDKLELTGEVKHTISPLAQLREMEQVRGRVVDTPAIQRALGAAIGGMQAIQATEVEVVVVTEDDVF